MIEIENAYLFGKLCLEAIRDERKGGHSIFFWGKTFNRSGRIKILAMKKKPPSFSFSGNPGPPIRNTQRIVLGLLSVMSLKRINVKE